MKLWRDAHFKGAIPSFFSSCFFWKCYTVSKQKELAMLDTAFDSTPALIPDESDSADARRKKFTRPGCGYRYVSRNPNGRFRGYLMLNGKYIHLGTYDDAETAAKVVDTWIVKLKGSQAELNFPADKSASQVSVLKPRRRRRRSARKEKQVDAVQESTGTEHGDDDQEPAPTAKGGEANGLPQLIRVLSLLESLTQEQRDILSKLQGA